MGSKNLKAIAVRGQERCPSWITKDTPGTGERDPQGDDCLPEYKRFRESGQSAGTGFTNKMALLAVRNFQSSQGNLKGSKNSIPEGLGEILPGTYGCHGCPIRCNKKFEVTEGPYKGEKGNKTEEGAWTPYGPVIGNSLYPGHL